MKRILSLTFISTLILNNAASAGEHEVTQSLLIGGLGRNAGAVLTSGEGTAFALGASYYKLVHSQIQLGATFDFLSGDNAAYEILGGVRFNFGSKGWRNDFFVNPSVGFAKLGTDDFDFVFDVGFGKRFLLLPNVAYMPTFSFFYLNDLKMRIDFVRFSVVW